MMMDETVDILSDEYFNKLRIDYVKRLLNGDEIEVLFKIYKRTKAQQNKFYDVEILKRIPGYANAHKGLYHKGLVQWTAGKKRNYKISEDGMVVGLMIVDLKSEQLID